MTESPEQSTPELDALLTENQDPNNETPTPEDTSETQIIDQDNEPVDQSGSPVIDSVPEDSPVEEINPDVTVHRQPELTGDSQDIRFTPGE